MSFDKCIGDSLNGGGLFTAAFQNLFFMEMAIVRGRPGVLGRACGVSHGKPHETKIRRRLSTSLRWPFPADLDPRNVSDLTHKSIFPAALFQVIKGIHNCSDPIR